MLYIIDTSMLTAWSFIIEEEQQMGKIFLAGLLIIALLAVPLYFFAPAIYLDLYYSSIK